MPLSLDIKSVNRSLNKAYLKETAGRSSIEKCKKQLLHLLEKADPASSEDTLKDYITDFLKNTWYAPEYAITINKGKKDFSIHSGKTAKEPVAVIAEVKKTGSPEMITAEKPNVKALHELVLYYLQERITGGNNQIKYLLATDVHQWYLIDANEFDKKIYSNTRIKKLYETYVNDKKDNPFFYDELKRILGESDITLTATLLQLDQYWKSAANNDPADDKKLVPLYKILSPVHLLKLPFANDSNSLDKNFYDELLHIIGLEEVKEGSKKLIQRKKDKSEASLIENALIKIWDKDCLRDLPDATKYGLTGSEQEYNIALELCITWINRILFLKLLEAQLVAYHQQDKSYQFLNETLLPDYDELNNLFFQVLAEVPENRRGHLQAKFSKVPYLNSSLFERTELERRTIDISALDNALTLPLHTATVLKDDKGKRKQGAQTTLSYLFTFLDRYNFTSEGKADIQEENKTLINASVLGLIFEKINGYKDGSFFTPGFITMYMCRETLRRAVTQKFNEHYGWSCENFDALQERIEFQDKEKRQEANTLINSLTICDPAVGSGHFLVSALNELISIKHDLKILQYRHNGQRIKEYSLEIVNDELIIQDVETEELFEYTLNQKGNSKAELQALQETLFHEKETLIENCLFGVDINENSVKICRLRLWIELLKNAYYTSDSQYTQLETLPNIDINIKKGNSLISRFALDADLAPALQKSKFSIESYKVAVQTYRNAESKEEKREMENLIETIKNDFQKDLSTYDPLNKKLSKLRGELAAFQQTDLFSTDVKRKTKANKELEKLSAAIDKLEKEKTDIKNNAIYKDAFEWRFMFPEVLDNEGVFVGFDVIVGNPPYISKTFDNATKKVLNETYITSQYQLDLYVAFIERAIQISKNNGQISYITPNSWLKNMMFTECRKYLLENTSFNSIAPNLESVFEEASVDTLIFITQKSKKYNSEVSILEVNNHHLQIKHTILQENFLNNERYVFDVEVNTSVKLILEKVKSLSVMHEKISDITRGVNPYDKYRGQSEEIIKNKAYHATFKKDETFIPEIRGKHLNSYTYIWDGKSYISYGPWLAAPRENKYFEGKRIIMRQVLGKKLVCAFINENIIIDQSVFISRINDEFKTQVDEKYIVALFSSLLYSYYFKHSSNEFDALFPKIKIGEFKELPIRLIPLDSQQPFITLVDQILAAKKTDPAADTSHWETEIDELVFDLYGLTEEEKGLVRGA